jgi:cytidyltransferase-like protein
MSKAKPIFSLSTLYKITHDLKAQGKKIAITHGSFDLFHLSHLDLLKKSASLCDFLIVGVESDAHVSTYKTYKRPIMDELSRASIINELNCVDGTFIYDGDFTQDGYTRLYHDLFIDTVTIGLNFSFKDTIEEQVTHSGARLVMLRTQQYPTTTTIINSVIQKYSKNGFSPVPKEN